MHLQLVDAGTFCWCPACFFLIIHGCLVMQVDVNFHSWRVSPRQLMHAHWMLLSSLLLIGCSGGETDTTQVGSSQASIDAPQQAQSETSRLPVKGTVLEWTKSLPTTVTDENAVPSKESASLARLSALPHLSSLSDREKAGLFMLLPSKSSSQRLELINLYPSLVELPVQQKEVLLDRLEEIVPVTVSQRR